METMVKTKLPRFIALCGKPKAGKSLVQEILRDKFGVTIVDDGAILREFAMQYLGATRDMVYTQEGKVSLAFWPNGDPMLDDRTGEHMTWRRVLGLLGNQLEAMFGKHVMPMTACARIANQAGPFSFGSVRRDQGTFYQRQGGVIVEIDNPAAVPTGNEFDEYDKSIVDHVILNDAMLTMGHPAALRDLEQKVDQLVEKIQIKPRFSEVSPPLSEYAQRGIESPSIVSDAA
jgi:hypothetical protein